MKIRIIQSCGILIISMMMLSHTVTVSGHIEQYLTANQEKDRVSLEQSTPQALIASA
jgi:hypothetical protein